MEFLDKLVEKAYKNNNKIKIDDINTYSLTDEQFEALIAALQSKNIEIDMTEILDNDSPDFYSDDSTACYFKEIIKYPLLSTEEERNLFKLYRSGNEASKQKLINSNLRLVVSVAKRYNISGISSSMNFLDIVQEGNIGLMKAIEKFKLESNTKLSTYAVCWIKQSIGRSIMNQGRTIRISIHIKEKIIKLQKYRTEFVSITGEEPTIEDYSNKFEYSKNEIANLLQLEQDIISLETPVGEDDTTELCDLISDDNCVSEDVERKMYYDQFFQKLKLLLNDREFKIILSRCGKEFEGIGSNRVMTLQEIGNNLGMSRERVRQIESRAYTKIRNKYSREFMENGKLKVY